MNDLSLVGWLCMLSGRLLCGLTSNKAKGSHPKIESPKVGTLSQPLLTPRPPTKLGTPYVFQGPNKLVGTHSTPYQISWLGHPTLLVRPPAPLLGQCPNFGTFYFLMASLTLLLF